MFLIWISIFSFSFLFFFLHTLPNHGTTNSWKEEKEKIVGDKVKKVFYGQEPPSEESTTTECGVNYQLLAVITEVAQCGTNSCSRPQLATDNGARDGRSNWLVAPPTLMSSAPELHVLQGVNAACKSQDLLRQPGLERASTGMPDQRTTCAATQGKKSINNISGQQEGIGSALQTRQFHIIKHRVIKIAPWRYWGKHKGPVVLRSSTARMRQRVLLRNQSTTSNTRRHTRQR